MGMTWKKDDPWEVRYALAKAYYEEHGNLNMPAKYKANGMWIAKWLNEQRQIYIGNRAGKQLREDQIQRLEAIGMEWSNRNHLAWSAAWNAQYEEAKAYYDAHGDLRVPDDYGTASGKKLNLWVARQRALYSEGKLPEKQIQALNKIGMTWKFDDPWETGFAHAKQFYENHHHLDVPSKYVCEDGYRLGVWLANQRSNHNTPSKYHKLSSEQGKRLERIGMIWSPSDSRWEQGYAHAKKYLEDLAGKPWQQTYRSPDGFKTGEWIRGQLRAWKSGSLRPERLTKLQAVGLALEKQGQSRKTAENRSERRQTDSRVSPAQ